MTERGVFAVDRGIWHHPAFAREPFTEREAWLWMVSAACWKDTRLRSGRKVVELKRGQLAFSERFLAEKWGWAKSTVRRFLLLLKNEAMIEALADRDVTRITICNYDKYAFYGTTRGPQVGPQNEPLADHSRTKEEEPKNLRKEKEDTADAVPSSPAYAFESGVIRLTQKDFDQWRDAFSHLDLKAELIALTPWAGDQPPGKWFFAVSGALAKRNREAKVATERRGNGNDPQFKWNGKIEGIV